jgi:allophanate hydrolase subunit 2
VITADIGVAGQAAPGDAITFALCTEADAAAALLARERALAAIEAGS